MWLKSFGLGIIQGWLWLFFLNGPLLYNTLTRFYVSPETVFMAFLLVTSVSYLLIAKMGKTVPTLTKNPIFLVFTGFLMAAGTLMAGLAPKDLNFFTYSSVVISGTLISGFSSAVLISIWGERYSSLPALQASLAFGIAVTVGTACFFVFSRLPLTIAVLGTALLPMASLILLRREIGRMNTTVDAVPDDQPPSFPFPGRLVVLIILFYFAGGLMHKMVAVGQQFGSYETFWLTNMVYFAVCLLAGGIVYANPGLDLRFLYQPILPLIGVGFVLFPVLHTSYPVVPFSFLQAGFALFDLYTWILFAYLAARHRFPGSVISWGMFLITTSIFTGELLFTDIFSKIIDTMQETDLIALLAALLMFAGTLIFKGQRETFAGWDLHQTGNSSGLEEIACTSSGETSYDSITGQVQIVAEEPSASIKINREDLPEKFAWQCNLTPREKQIMLLLIEGRNNPYIRENLNISNNTLKTHLRNIYSKLSVNDRQELLDLYNEFKEGLTK